MILNIYKIIYHKGINIKADGCNEITQSIVYYNVHFKSATGACGMFIHPIIFVHVSFSVTVLPARCDCMVVSFIHLHGE